MDMEQTTSNNTGPTVIQVTNVSPTATQQQMKELFSYMGDIEEIKLYPEDESKLNIPSRVCFISFKDQESANTALHLSKTVFIDRPLIVGRTKYFSIPSELSAMSMAAPAVNLVNRPQPVGHTAPLLPTPPSILGQPTMIQQPLISLMGTVVPQPPPLTGNVDPTKIEEIRRTVYVGNLNSNLTAEQVLTFFQPCGEIKYVRMAGDETQPTRFAFVEFSSPDSVPIALQYNGAMFGDRPIKVNHSKNAIVKPQGPTAQEQKKEVEEAMRRVREATMAIAEVIDPEAVKETKPKRSRSRSYSRSRSRSRDRGRRQKSRSRSRDRDRRQRSRSRSPRRRRSNSRSPPRRRYRSHSRSPRRRFSRNYRDRRGRRSRSRSPPPRRRERERDRERERERDRERDRERERDRDRGKERDRHSRRSSRERARDRSLEKSSRKSPRRSPRKSPSPSPPRKSRPHKKKEREREKERERSKSRSPSPFEEYGPDHSKKPKKAKKEKKHRRKHPSPTPSPSPSPEKPPARQSSSRSPSPEQGGIGDSPMSVPEGEMSPRRGNETSSESD